MYILSGSLPAPFLFPGETIVQQIYNLNLSRGLYYEFLTLVGYRLLRASTYLSGVIAGFLVAYIIFLEFSHLAYPLMLCISGSIAVSFGFVTMLLEPVAVIILSLQSGVCIGSLSGVILYGLLHTISGWIFYIMVVIPAISITLLSLPDRLQKQLIIFNTSMTSASLIATFIDNFLFNGATLTYLYTLFKSINMSAPCTSSWVFAGVCVTSTTLGVLIQSLFTARGVVHHKGESSCTGTCTLLINRLHINSIKL